MHRRTFLRSAVAAAVAAPFTPTGKAFADVGTTENAATNGWQEYEVTTEVEIAKPVGETRVWLPLPLARDTSYLRTQSASWTSTGAASIQSGQDPQYGAGFLAVAWPDATSASEPKSVRLVTRFATRNRSADLSTSNGDITLSAQERALWTHSTTLLPTDGIVRDTAIKATLGATTDLDKAKALYQWIVDNTFRDPKTRGCGVGNVKYMLETNNLGGKCADLNGLYVAMARSLGIPARDVYGIRVADSARGYKCLGRSGDITKAQHCRAEFFADGHGWIAVDPADVRKVVLEEEKGGLTLSDAKVIAIRDYLFGNWEMNWLAFNCGHDIALPGTSRGNVGFLMYPNGETAEGRLDTLDPDNFKYRITARPLPA